MAASCNPSRHSYRPGSQQECTACESRVDEVLAKAAEDALSKNDCDAVADNQHPVRKRYRANECQQHAGNGCGQIHNGILLAYDLVVDCLEYHAGNDGNRGHQDGAQSKYICR